MDRILLGHGSGGKLMHEMLDKFILKELDNEILRQKNDSAILTLGKRKIAFTTDSYVVDPIIFPGGDIGRLAVCGTVNDLAVCGAKPLYISVAAIIEEGLDMGTLKRVIASIKTTAKEAGVKVVTGDTKVVEKGSCDKIFINTSGIGEVVRDGLSINNIRPGDVVIVNGPIGEHAVAVLSRREGISFKSTVKSDLAPLNRIIDKILGASKNVHFMRDPTRGGVATTLNEMVKKMPFGITIDESSLPVSSGVRGASELLGLDPLYLACEGRVLVVAPKAEGEKIVRIMKKDPLGRGAKVIARVSGEYPGKVVVNTVSGGRRIADMLTGEQLPRIC
jgi:hydrogenase expression/formation protein HypE